VILIEYWNREVSMRIGVNMLCARKKHSGIGVYSINIVNELAKHPDDEYVIFTGWREEIEDMLTGNIRFVDVKYKDKMDLSRLFAEQITIPRLAAAENLDLMFTPGFYMPFFSSMPQVVTIHDLIHKTWPGDMSIKTRMIMNVLIDSSIRRADGVIAVSGHTAGDIERFIGREKGVRVIYEGRGIAQINRPERPDVMKDIDRYALVVGNIMPRKNPIGIIKAFESVMGSTDLKLVFVGGLTYKGSDISEYINNKGISDRVIIAGYLQNKEISWCYKNASMLLYCSFYEGFGIPPLEAMAEGIPVIASDVSSIPEIVGNAAILINPNNQKEIAEAIIMLDRDNELRKRCVSNGKKRITLFTWEKAARETRDMLVEIAMQKGR